jgi:hypothetical protein
MAWEAGCPPGTFRKELGGAEKIYRFMSTAFHATGHEHWGIYAICTVQFSSSFPPREPSTALRDAWKRLRFENPALAIVPAGYTAVYSVPNAAMVEDWAQQTFILELNKSAEDIISHYPLRDLPALYYFPSTSEIMFLTSHWRVDGIGSCLLLDRLFTLIGQQSDFASITWEHDLEKISPSLEDAIGSPEIPSPEIEKIAECVNKNFQQKVMHAIGLAYKGDSKTPPAKPASQSLAFTQKSSSNLFAACKKRQIGVSATIHAALAETAFALTPEEGVTEYATIMAVNMRPYLKPPYNSPAHACRTYVSSITPTVQRDSNFAQRAAMLTQQFKTWHTEQFSLAVRQIYHVSSQALLDRRSVSSLKPPSGITLSSLGVVEQFLAGNYDGVVRISRFRFGVSMMNRQMLLYVWTFGGQLNLSINYNDAYYDASTPLQVLHHIQATLETELDLAMESI